MNLSNFKLKKILTIYQVTNSYFFNNKHNADSYLKRIEQILNHYDLLDGRELLGHVMTSEYFKTVVYRRNLSDNQIDCEIDFDTTTLTIVVKE